MKHHYFLCVGYVKCGTTSLHEVLKQHNDIYLPIEKEPLYYYNPALYKKGFRWYQRRFFPKRISEKYLGEINPSITLKDNAQKVFRDYGPNIKLIFIMRNPVERAYSDFKFAERNVSIDTDKKELNHGNRFDYVVSRTVKSKGDGKYELINSAYKNLIKVGCYSNSINQYLKYYPITNMKFILFEDYIKNPKEVSEDLLDFLNIPVDNTVNYNIKANEGNLRKKNQFTGDLYDLLCNARLWFLTHTPFLGNKLESFITNLWLKAGVLLSKEDKDKSKMSEDTRKILEEYYREDKNKLKALIHKDLDSAWFK